MNYMVHVSNMEVFNELWKDYADNIQYGEALRENRGHILTLDPRPYQEWLTNFNIPFRSTVYPIK